MGGFLIPKSSGVRELLLAKKAERALINQEDLHSSSLKQVILELRQLNESIQTIRKNRVFDDEISPEELEIIDKRVELQQRQFQEYQNSEQNRKIHRILGMWDFLSRQEIILALDQASQNEDTAIVNFTDPSYIHAIRKQIAQSYSIIKLSSFQSSEPKKTGSTRKTR